TDGLERGAAVSVLPEDRGLTAGRRGDRDGRPRRRRGGGRRRGQLSDPSTVWTARRSELQRSTRAPPEVLAATSAGPETRSRSNAPHCTPAWMCRPSEEIASESTGCPQSICAIDDQVDPESRLRYTP